jgi:hypothetical protein
MSQFNPLLQSQEPIYYEMELPSKGIPYMEDGTVDKIFQNEGLTSDGKVDVRALTTKDELIWTDQKLVENLKAPMIILKNTVLGLKNPELLIRADVEAMLLHARVLTYGKMTKVNWACSECGNSNELNVDYTKLPIKKLNDFNELMLNFKNYEIYMIPIIFKEAVEIQKANDNDISEQLDKIVSCIQRVDVTDSEGKQTTVKDKSMIAQWVEQVNPKDFRHIIDHFTEVNKIGTVMDLDVKCAHCSYKEKTDVVVDITNFFSEED